MIEGELTDENDLKLSEIGNILTIEEIEAIAQIKIRRLIKIMSIQKNVLDFD